MFWRKVAEPMMPVDEHREIVRRLEEKVLKANGEAQRTLELFTDIKKERDDLKSKVREQTEADLLLVSLRIAEEIKAGKKRKDEPLNSLALEQQRLMSQQRAMRASGGFLGQASSLHYQFI